MRGLLKIGSIFFLGLIACESQVVEFPKDGGAGGAGGHLSASSSVGAGGSTSVSSSSSSSVSTGGNTSVSSSSGSGGCCSDEQCPPGLLCEAGVCVDPCSGVECPEGFFCQGGLCINPCDGVECPEGLVCKNGTCVDPCDGVECTEGKVCQDGVCVCDGEPSPESSCAEGKTLLCHIPPGNPSALHDVCVGDAAVSAHLAHGDYLGTCQK